MMEESKQEFQEKEKNWKGIISRLEKELIEAQLSRNNSSVQ